MKNTTRKEWAGMMSVSVVLLNTEGRGRFKYKLVNQYYPSFVFKHIASQPRIPEARLMNALL